MTKKTCYVVDQKSKETIRDLSFTYIIQALIFHERDLTFHRLAKQSKANPSGRIQRVAMHMIAIYAI